MIYYIFLGQWSYQLDLLEAPLQYELVPVNFLKGFLDPFNPPTLDRDLQAMWRKPGGF
jgi:hypothetical protein